jgi:hypothetical protein
MHACMHGWCQCRMKSSQPVERVVRVERVDGSFASIDSIELRLSYHLRAKLGDQRIHFLDQQQRRTNIGFVY